MPGLMFACFLLGGLQPPVDYCGDTFCPPGVPNVGCNPPPLTGGPACEGKSPAIVEITTDLQSYILDQLNTHRSIVATGGLSPFLPARRMPTLQWDNELVNQAGHNARNCGMPLLCSNTAQFRHVARIGILYSFFGNTIAVEQIIGEIIQYLWSHHTSTSTDNINSYTSDPELNQQIRFFAEMVNDRSWKVGCAMQYFSNDATHVYSMVCIFSFTVIPNQPVYVTASTPAEGCTTGENPNFAGLCSINEVIQSVL